jgi:YggT family protein
VVRLLCDLVLLYEVAIILRIVLSWFPLRSGGFPAKANGVLVAVTDPVLVPLRRILPRTGLIDLSPLVALLALEIVVRQLILRCA